MKHARGNILFLILLAVVLFAALSYAVTGSMRGGGKSGGTESAQAMAADVMSYFAQLDTAVQRMMLTGGVKDYELNFYYQSISRYVYGGNDNPNCTESRCRVFDPAGGGVSGQPMMRFTRGKAYDNRERILYLGIPGVGTSAPDIVFQVGSVDSNLCKAINAKFGVNDILYNASFPLPNAVIPYQFSIPVGPIADGGYVLSGISNEIGNTGTFCICPAATQELCEADTNAPRLFHVLVAR